MSSDSANKPEKKKDYLMTKLDMDYLSQEQQQLAISLAMAGLSAVKIAKKLGISQYNFYVYREINAQFSIRFDAARTEGLETLADGLLNINDRYDDVQKARLQSDNVKWILSKRHSSKYGDKLDVNVSQTVDISGALNDALKRTGIDALDVTPTTANTPLFELEATTDPEPEQDVEVQDEGIGVDDDIFK